MGDGKNNMGIKDFMIRKMLETKLKQVPKEEQEKILTLIEKNPELFQKIATEMQEEIAKGKDQMTSAMQIMQKYKDEIQRAMNS